jgi:hypothetical protein
MATHTQPLRAAAALRNSPEIALLGASRLLDLGRWRCEAMPTVCSPLEPKLYILPLYSIAIYSQVERGNRQEHRAYEVMY